jgi:hypothetical protein
MTIQIQNRVLCLDAIPEGNDWINPFQDGRADQVYFNAEGKSDAEIIAAAIKLRVDLQDVKRLFEPVVIGPIGPVSNALRPTFNRYLIRVTDKSFSTYCERVGHIRAGAPQHVRTH